MDNKKYSLLFFLFIFLQSVGAQDKDSILHHKLSDIVVSATRTPNSTLFLAGSISVIDSEEISRREKILLLDLIKGEYGLSYTSQGNPGDLSFINIRGASNGHTLVLIDGIEMNMTNDPANAFNFSTIPTNNIERIEILRGPQSTLYGSDALAGVINIFTKKGNKGLKLNLLSEGGSYNTFRGNAGASGGTGIFSFNLNYGKITSDGYSAAAEKFGNTEKDGFSNSTISAGAGFQFNPMLDINLRYHFTKAAADLDRQGGINGDDPTYVSDVEESGFRTTVNLNLFEDIWEQTASVSFNRNLRKYNYSAVPNWSSSSNSRYDGNKLKIDWQNNFNIPYNIVTAGAEFEKEKASSDYYEFYYFDSSSFSSVFPRNENSTYGIFLQDQFSLKNSFFITGGVRYDKNKIFGSEITYKIAPAYLILSTGTKFKGTYGTGFKSPSLFYLFDPLYGNTELNPEKSSGWDLGIEQYFDRLQVKAGITYFNMHFKDMFGFDPLTFKTININEAETKGTELYLSIAPFNNSDIKLSYTYTEVRDLRNESFSSFLIRKPKHKAFLGIDYSFLENGYSGIEMIYTGIRSDYTWIGNAIDNMRLDDYLLMNITGSWKFFDMVKVYFRIENLLDEEYEEIYGFGTAGLSVYGGVKIDTGDIFGK